MAVGDGDWSGGIVRQTQGEGNVTDQLTVTGVGSYLLMAGKLNANSIVIKSHGDFLVNAAELVTQMLQVDGQASCGQGGGKVTAAEINVKAGRLYDKGSGLLVTTSGAGGGGTIDNAGGTWQHTGYWLSEGTFKNGGGARLELTEFDKDIDSSIIDNVGEMLVSVNVSLINGAEIRNSGLVELRGDIGLTGGGDWTFRNRAGGALRKSEGDGRSTVHGEYRDEGGTIEVQRGVLEVGGKLYTAAGAGMRVLGPGTLVSTGAHAFGGGGGVTIEDARFVLDGTGTGYDEATGAEATILLHGSTTTLSGTGTTTAKVFAQFGTTVAPGGTDGAMGRLTVGAAEFNNASKLRVRLVSPSDGGFDQLVVTRDNALKI